MTSSNILWACFSCSGSVALNVFVVELDAIDPGDAPVDDIGLLLNRKKKRAWN